LAALKKGTQIFIDSRPGDKRETLLPALAEAIQNRHIQCVIAPSATFKESPPLAQLTVPTAFAGNPGSLNRASFDLEDFLREGLRCLARQGCRSVGLLGHFPHLAQQEGNLYDVYPYHESLVKVIHEEGLVTRPEWISKWPDARISHENHGYLARGVITAVLKYGIEVVPAQMKFVFHRNAHANLLCPFPVTWGITDEDMMAKRLIQIIEKQFRGEKVMPTLIPCEMKFDDASKWQ